VPFFAVLSLCALILAGQGPTPLHWVLYHALPGFEWMHPHGPGRIKVILYLGLALLAGATLSSLGKRGLGLGAVMVLPALTVLFLSSRLVALFATGDGAGGSSLAGLGLEIPVVSLLALAGAGACAIVCARSPVGCRAAAFVVVLLVFADLSWREGRPSRSAKPPARAKSS
jgi:hypothetical protein